MDLINQFIENYKKKLTFYENYAHPAGFFLLVRWVFPLGQVHLMVWEAFLNGQSDKKLEPKLLGHDG